MLEHFSCIRMDTGTNVKIHVKKDRIQERHEMILDVPEGIKERMRKNT